MSAEGQGSEGTSLVFAEARSVLVAQVNGLANLDRKASQIVQFNAVVVGILVAALSAGASWGRGDVPLPAFLLIGFSALVVSTLFGVLAFYVRQVHVGLDGRRLVAAPRL